MIELRRNSIAELIESYLLDRLTKSENNYLELRRLDIANELGCAPSQVTYVLGTRFSVQNGFQVESRRGNGGFIRIHPLEMIEHLEEEFVALEREDFSISDEVDLSFCELEKLPNSFQKIGLLTRKECEMLQKMMGIIKEWVPETQRQKSAKELIKFVIHFE